MNNMFLTSETSPNTVEKFEKALGFIGDLETLYGIIGFVILCVLFCCSVISFRKRINKISAHQLCVFKRNKKYIPELFTELNYNLENLRYFVFSKHWKRRIIREYNHQFRNSQGKEIAKIISNDSLTKKLAYRTSVNDLMTAIDQRRKIIEQLNNEREENRRRYGEKIFFIREYTYFIPAKLSLLYTRCELLKARNIIIVGSAGNGKTNLLCNLVENVIKNNAPCLFINSRDVECDCFDYVINKLVPEKLLRIKRVYLWVISKLLTLSNKYFFVVIDAINENDSEVFASSIGKMIDQLSKYKRIKVICSCRSEYFDVRYKKYFEKCVVIPYIFPLDQVDYDDRAKEKMMFLYQRHYNVHVALSANVRERLMHSLLLMRLFFEVNTGRNTDNLELRDAEIYKAYLEKVTQDAEPFDFQGRVNDLARRMVGRKDFKEVKLDDLGLSTEDRKRFKSVLDDNLVISRKIQAGTGITERNVEYVYFVFDELRDFCLARYLLTAEEEKKDEAYSDFFLFVEELNAQCLSPLEGVLKYAYHYFKKINRYDLCQSLLDKFSDFVPQDKQNWWDRQSVFANFGLSLVFQAASELLEFELEYIVKCIAETPSSFWEIYRFLLKNEYVGAKPDTELLTSLILDKISYTDMQKVVAYFFSDRDNKYYYKNTPRAIDNLCDTIDKFSRNKGGLPMHMKTFLVILASLEPHEVALGEYGDFVHEVVALPEVKSCNSELKQAIIQLKERHDRIKVNVADFFEELLGGDVWNEE